MPTVCAWPYFHDPLQEGYSGADKVLEMSLSAEGKPEGVPARAWRWGSSTFQEEQGLACGKVQIDLGQFFFHIEKQKGRGINLMGEI